MTHNQFPPFIINNLQVNFESDWKQEAQRATYRAPDYNVPSFWRIGQILLPVKFRWIPISCFREEDKNVLSQSRGQDSHLVFPNGLKKDFVENFEILLPVKLPWILLSGFRGKVENVLANQRPGRPSCFSDRLEKHKLGRGSWDLASCQVSLTSVQLFQSRSWKCLSQLEAMAAILVFQSVRKTNLVEDVETSLPVKYCWIPFSSFRGEVKNVSANQRPGKQSCFSKWPEKTQTW